jgi:alkaline phosphatase D
VGVIALVKDPRGKAKIEKGYYFRLQREFDRTGTFVMGKDVTLGRHESDGIPPKLRDVPDVLSPDTFYAVRVGTLSIDDPMPDDESLSDVELDARLPSIENIAPMLLQLPADRCEATFRTFPREDAVAASLSFLIGSCRYPGLLWKVKEADRIFGPMSVHLRDSVHGPAARFTVMVGDQIYADTLNRFIPVGLADTYEEFQERYQTALGSANMRELLRQAPTYMTLDDHEIEDNWSQDRLKDGAKHRLFNLALGAYMSYQWSHGPRSYGRLLYYQFACAGYPFFALDTRTQRFKDDEVGLRDNHLLGRPPIDPLHPGQLGQFLTWLTEQQKRRGDAPKFVISSSVFAPNEMSERISERKNTADEMLFEVNLRRREASDSWPAYPLTRRAILDHIVKNRIQNVVFLTGDIHCSNIARLDFGKGAAADLCAYDITSSAFYWPFPFADGDPNNYVHDSRAADQLDPFPIADGEMNYRAWAFTQEDNFCRVDIDKGSHSLSVRYYGRDSDILKVADEKGAQVTVNTLPMARWK